MSEDLEQVKMFFLDEYRKNGGTDDISKLNVAEIMVRVEKQKEIKALHDELFQAKSNANEKKQVGYKINSVDAAKENAELAKQAAYVIRNTANYMDPPIDMKVMDDESYARDNNLGQLWDLPGEGVILRDNDGRVDAGGRSKYPGGFRIEW